MPEGKAGSVGVGELPKSLVSRPQALRQGCAGVLVNPKFPSAPSPRSHPFCWPALIPAGVALWDRGGHHL